MGKFARLGACIDENHMGGRLYSGTVVVSADEHINSLKGLEKVHTLTFEDSSIAGTCSGMHGSDHHIRAILLPQDIDPLLN